WTLYFLGGAVGCSSTGGAAVGTAAGASSADAAAAGGGAAPARGRAVGSGSRGRFALSHLGLRKLQRRTRRGGHGGGRGWRRCFLARARREVRGRRCDEH